MVKNAAANGRPDRGKADRSMWKILKAVFLIALVMFFATFAVENSSPAQINWFSVLIDYETPLYVLMYGFFVFGIVIGLAVGGSQRFSLWQKSRKQQKEIARLMEMSTNGNIEAHHHIPETFDKEQS
ncbi:MAG: hypothetical protein AVO39_10780 [delta proteobacterium MLS_D]|jgi:uncharacterized integral membrane protein|nr:MAG: hypothetical protein AVO39_10780 [delta proteobacterium MLS_D]